ncbi:F-box domain-containing protein [Heracleum sosnowskyi]|uniref:F-box domain-containing protein n=1 Tax=Heracleum sosnowskyi TaxID=360622 RepID=A0AAD8ML22_9APIA|nr:F-box domain-containing protein [Heracleum sosnowskyi]KAK1376746.1 F-box domain-containing protein [Heracleum sosnowskyi]
MDICMDKIFIRLPVKSLLRARCISKSWRKFIDNPDFANFAHMKYEYCEDEQNTLILRASRAETTSLYAATGCEESSMILAETVPMVKFQVERTVDYGSCNGLVYFAENYSGRFVVSNPLRSQFTVLPQPPERLYYPWNSDWSATGLGFDSSTKTFKMICTNRKTKSDESPQFTLVHTLGTTSWREVPSVPAHYCKRTTNSMSVFVHGFLHWMIHPSIRNSGEGRILAFDVSKETFKVIPHPEISFKGSRYYRILDIKGNLGMLDLSREVEFDIWIMDYEKESWTKEYTIDITTVDPYFVDMTQVIGLWKQDEILFRFWKSRFLVMYWSYSMRTGNIKECEVPSSNAGVLSLKGSLIPIPGAKEVS